MPERVYVVYVWCHGMRWGRTPWRPPPKRWPTFRQWLTAEAVANTTSVAVRRRPEAPEVVIGTRGVQLKLEKVSGHWELSQFSTCDFLGSRS